MKHDARIGVSTDTKCNGQERGQELTHLEQECGVVSIETLHKNPSKNNIIVVLHKYILYIKKAKSNGYSIKR